MNPRYSGSHRRVILGRIAALLAAGIVPGALAVAQCDPSANPNIGCFTSVTPTAQTQLLVYPSATHTFQMIAKSSLTKYTGSNTNIGTNNDFTADIVRVRVGGEWRAMSKIGRRACENPDLVRVQ